MWEVDWIIATRDGTTVACSQHVDCQPTRMSRIVFKQGERSVGCFPYEYGQCAVALPKSRGSAVDRSSL
jgi:hypothetical protein